MTDTAEPKLLTVKQAADELNISEWMMRDLVRNFRIDVVRVGRGRGLIRVPRTAIEDFIAGRTVKAVNQCAATDDDTDCAELMATVRETETNQ